MDKFEIKKPKNESRKVVISLPVNTLQQISEIANQNCISNDEVILQMCEFAISNME